MATVVPASSFTSPPITIGVLGLQGAYIEHIVRFRELGISIIDVRTPEDLEKIDGLVIPGGESTTISNVAERWGMVEPLKQFVKKQKKPVFGTCAGLIMLSEKVEAQKQGGQVLIGGIDAHVQRNHYGTQLGSFETNIEAPMLAERYGGEKMSHAVFIRAPGILETGKDVEILGKIAADNEHAMGKEVTVAIRQGPILATTFHPELTKDYRWHRLFVDLVRYYKANQK